MPCSEQCQDVYHNYFESVEYHISQLSHNPLLIMGDLNADLNVSFSDHNRRSAMKWNNLIETYQLCDLSTSQLLVLPTIQVLGTQLLNIIIFGNQEAAQSATSCQTVEEHPLNTSDHLPICWSFDISHLRTITPQPFPESTLDWQTAYKYCTSLLYASQVDDFIRPFLSKEYCLESSLTIISEELLSIANLCIPK